MLASFGLIIPAVSRFNASAAGAISREFAVVLFLIYLAGLVAILVNQKSLMGRRESRKSSRKRRAA